MQRCEVLELGHQPAVAEGRLGGDTQDFGFAAVAEDVAAGDVHLIEDFVHFGQVQGAGRRQVQALAHSLEEVVAEHFLQLRHLLTDGALGQVQLLGGAGETEVASGRFEALQGGHRRR
ncbi:hypothetical protein D3C84_444870 [compost metagenome]